MSDRTSDLCKCGHLRSSHNWDGCLVLVGRHAKCRCVLFELHKTAKALGYEEGSA